MQLKVHHKFDCDVFLPKLDEELFEEVEDESVPKEMMEFQGLSYTHKVFQRKAQ